LRPEVARSRRKPLETLSSSELATEYEKAASLYGEAVEGGSAKTTNKQYDILQKLEQELKKRRADGRAAVLGLLSHGDRGIRLCAASVALDFAPEQAESVLEALSDGKGTISFNAKMLLQEWRKGNIEREDWPP